MEEKGMNFRNCLLVPQGTFLSWEVERDVQVYSTDSFFLPVLLSP